MRTWALVIQEVSDDLQIHIDRGHKRETLKQRQT